MILGNKFFRQEPSSCVQKCISNHIWIYLNISKCFPKLKSTQTPNSIVGLHDCLFSKKKNNNSDEELRFMHRIDQSHIVVFCIITIWPRGLSTLTSQDYSPSSVVYVPEPIRAILQYLASIETYLVVMTLSQFLGPFSLCTHNTPLSPLYNPTLNMPVYIRILVFYSREIWPTTKEENDFEGEAQYSKLTESKGQLISDWLSDFLNLQKNKGKIWWI